MIKVGVIGGAGYTGAELLRLLTGHSEVELMIVTSRSEQGRLVSNLFPFLRGLLDIRFSDPNDERLFQCDIVFFATPDGVAMKRAPGFLSRGIRVIDLAADFRLKNPSDWKEWYGLDHSCPRLLDDAIYGLPEVNRHKIAKARLVANPGCYPTAAQIGLLPVIESGLAEGAIIIDAKSGVSGAGRAANVANLMCETSESLKAYGVSGHRHLPEISQGIQAISNQASGGDFTAKNPLTFVPHLAPMIRGIHATIYCQLKDHSIDLQTLFERRFESEPFVDVLPSGSHPETRSVKAGNYCRVAVHRPQGSDTVVILSVIDNLMKGAAGQAVQNMNIMCGISERSGLDISPVFI